MKDNKSMQLTKTANSNCLLAKVDYIKLQVEFQNSNQKNVALNGEIDRLKSTKCHLVDITQNLFFEMKLHHKQYSRTKTMEGSEM